MNQSRWENSALERIQARRRKIGELLADQQDVASQERQWNQLQHLSFLESFVLASLKISKDERVVSGAERRKI